MKMKPFEIALLVILFVIISCLAYKKAHGADLQISGGTAVIRGPTEVVGLDVIQPGVVAGFGDLGCGFNLVAESKWSAPAELYSSNYTNKQQLFAHCDVYVNFNRLSLGVGIAEIQHDDAYNSGRVNLSLSASVRVWKDLSVKWQHYSNSDTSYPNYGRDLLLLSWRMR